MTRRTARGGEFGSVRISAVSGFEEAPRADYRIDHGVELETERIQTVLEAARKLGMLDTKTARISGRISPALIEQAKRRTGMESDTDLIEFALASVALDDPFVEVFRQARGTIDPDIELGY